MKWYLVVVFGTFAQVEFPGYSGRLRQFAGNGKKRKLALFTIDRWGNRHCGVRRRRRVSVSGPVDERRGTAGNAFEVHE